jgi:hypothetical protein
MRNTIISICSKSHSDVWKLTSKLLPMNVRADNYIVYVPENEIKHFESITPPGILVKAQEQLGIEFEPQLRQRLEAASNQKRFGWYLQQFYKIQAIQEAATEIVTIWDADCVPVAPIEITNNHDQIVYVNSSKEYHEEYFRNIKRLLNLDRVQDLCFVIPGFPLKLHWVTEFITSIEEKHRKPWFEAIMETTDFSQVSGFSETETLGTWVANSYPTEWISRRGTWERFGQSRFGYAKNLNVENLIALGQSNSLEIITFENWDTRGFKRVKRLILRLVSKLR